MKIGIGVITYNRPEHYKLCMEKIYANTPRDGSFQIVIAMDTNDDRKGIAYRSNECLCALKDCDFVFLLNDDCFPIADGWAEFFIEAHKASGQHHFMYLLEMPTIKKGVGKLFPIMNERGLPPYKNLRIDPFNNCAGCFMFLTREVIEKVGAFNEEFGIYGFEHAEYSKRIHLAGLTPMGEYLCPANADKYLYALDLQNDREVNKQLKHKPSMSSSESLGHLQKASQVWERPITKIYRPL